MTPDMLQNWALQTGLSVAILVGLILLIRRPFARRFGAKAAYALWALPLLRLVMPSIDLPWLRPAAITPAAMTPASDPAQNTANVLLTPEMIAALQSPEIAAPPPSFWAAHSAALILGLWIGGALLFAASQLYRQSRSEALWLKAARPASENLRQLGNAIAVDLGLNRAPILILSPSASGPLVSNVFRPKIILPAGFETEFTAQEQRYALYHELAHIRRGDLFASSAALALRALNWPNPLVHLAARYFRADQEAACDATVLRYMARQKDQSAARHHCHDYAQTLIKAALHAQAHMSPPRVTPALALTIHHPLKERLMSLSNPAPHQKLKHRLAATAIAAFAFAVNAPVHFVPAAQSTETQADHASDQASELAGAPQTPTPPPTPPTVDRSKPIIYGGATTQKHVVQSKTKKNGIVQERKVEISVDGDEVRAFEIDPQSGIKTEINPKTIDGYELITKGPGQFKIDAENGHVIRFAQSDDADVDAVIKKLKAEGKLDDKTIQKVIRIVKTEDGNSQNVWVDENSDDIKVFSGTVEFDFDDEELLDGLDLSELGDAVNVKLLKNFTSQAAFIGDDNVKVIFADGEVSGFATEARLQAVESMLESAKKMLSETDETSRSLAKAQKELGDAMKALEKARAELDAGK